MGSQGLNIHACGQRPRVYYIMRGSVLDLQPKGNEVCVCMCEGKGLLLVAPTLGSFKFVTLIAIIHFKDVITYVVYLLNQ